MEKEQVEITEEATPLPLELNKAPAPLQEEENKEQGDTIRVESNDTGSFDFANGEEDKEHEDF